MRFWWIVLSLCVILFLAGCSGSSQATPDLAATEAAIAGKIFATLTASAPTSSPLPTATVEPAAAPTASPVAVSTSTALPPTALPATPAPTAAPASPAATEPPSAVPTATAESPVALVTAKTLQVRAGPGTTYPVVAAAKQGDKFAVTGRNQDSSWLEVVTSGTRKGWVPAALVQPNSSAKSVALVESIPTLPPTRSPAPPATQTPPASSRDLEVTWVKPHYNCEQGTWEFESPKGITHQVWGYRSFQADMYIKNNGQEPVNPPWQPKRWIITNGQIDVVNDLMWQWLNRSGDFYRQPNIGPGDSAGWTFVAYPLAPDEWVKAVEFVWKDQVYRQEFDRGSYGETYNYVNCGEPHVLPQAYPPTPTPRP